MHKLKVLGSVLAIGLAVFSQATLAKEYKIGASLLTQQHPFYIDLADAMKAEAKKDDVVLNISIANQDLNKQLSDVEDFITKKVDAIIISPVDSKGVQAAIIKAEKAGIPVITVDVAAEGVPVVTHVATDNYAGGVEAGKLMGKLLNGKGKVAIIDYPALQSVVARVDGFKKGLADTPDVKIVAIQTGITRAEALTVAQNMMQAHPDLNGLFGFGDDAALAAVIAAKSARNDNIKIIGFDGMKEARDAVDSDKTFVAVIRQYPDQMGAKAIDAAVDHLNGKPVAKLIPVAPGVYTGK
ncbi:MULTISPECIES: substrate-binding domain-containing protein [Serratia]|jgi:ribose transport system substrate-binding protein|uniref:D-ribose-binding periplasmic protein n=2 Tax=Serratia fonticola TaxID=47917 RepID=A0A0F7H7S9_SERFO|nr:MULTISPECIES: substrate-binding domain-containing protein [Serratia]AKG68572.1 sugar ABC transporter [Serratia fonticola]MBC3230867.1 substrate-binding domain-containing protein [Serratia fonticola]MBL5827635.1 substrate-binding domain-containing protein [Serratia fonticola]MBL5861635.1 substrate-binding domain-containing protein [Serratia fonticola]MDQ7209341.1 substrate-binding domain-containing protein [Serratia fonticola]